MFLLFCDLIIFLAFSRHNLHFSVKLFIYCQLLIFFTFSTILFAATRQWQQPVQVLAPGGAQNLSTRHTPSVSTDMMSCLTSLLLPELLPIHPVDLGVSPDLMVRRFVHTFSNAGNTRSESPLAVAVDWGHVGLVQGDPRLDLSSKCPGDDKRTYLQRYRVLTLSPKFSKQILAKSVNQSATAGFSHPPMSCRAWGRSQWYRVMTGVISSWRSASIRSL